ncbi:MAG: DinB family protein [Actinomycetota bacterium]|nr:DinB family protein [Actinomycetota bacterium]
MERKEIHDELDRVCADFAALIDLSPVADMRQPSDGTKWTNEELLFHMLFGYLLVRNLMPIVRGFSRLPDDASRRFAATLNAAAKPFHTINYLGSLGGARVLGYPGMQRLMRHVIRDLNRSLDRRTDDELDRGMHFPVGWDPYFQEFLTLRQVYHYATQHYQHHRRQLTLSRREI